MKALGVIARTLLADRTGNRVPLALSVAASLCILLPLVGHYSGKPVSSAARPTTLGAGLSDRPWQRLFGTPEPASSTVTAAPSEFRLDGTVAFEDAPERGLALITVSGQSQLVSAGAVIGGAKVVAVYTDRVVLTGAAGDFELGFAAGNGPLAPRRRVFVPPPPPVKVLEERIADATEPFLAVVKATPLLNAGRYAGLIVEPNGNMAAFRSLGLQPGDVITAVNRLQLNEDSLHLLADAVRAKEPVKLWVMRAGSAGAGQEITLNTAVLGY